MSAYLVKCSGNFMDFDGDALAGVVIGRKNAVKQEPYAKCGGQSEVRPPAGAWSDPHLHGEC